MGGGAHSDGTEKEYTWEEIEKHQDTSSRWIVVDNKVYDVTRWAYKHPGGSKVLGHYCGQDGTEPFRAFHKDIKRIGKYLGAIKLGCVDSKDPEEKRRLKEDFEELRKKAEDLGLFRANPLFFILHFIHIFILEALAFLTLWYFGTGWIPYIAAVVIYATAQTQASWTQHDYGHLSVFPTVFWNQFFHQITMSYFKGASSNWWKHMHNQHHSKPNVMDKDPDVRIQPLFVVGETMPVEVGKAGIKTFPYNLQHRYFFVTLPPLLFPLYFQIMTFRHAIIRRCYVDLVLMALFFVKIFVLYGPLLGYGGAFLYYFLVRMAESHWFTWVSQSNHIPMAIERDTEEAWLKMQIAATCDIEQSFFNDWFTGHLNFQIEHHLFPLMPRHNYVKARPLVEALCKKHGVKYQVKPLWRAFCDIIRSLRHSGELWYAAYHAHHME